MATVYNLVYMVHISIYGGLLSHDGPSTVSISSRIRDASKSISVNIPRSMSMGSYGSIVHASCRVFFWCCLIRCLLLTACFSQLGRHVEALADAEEAIRLNPGWPKGYSRKAAAHFFLTQFDEAHAAYSKALELAPNDQLIAQALADVTAEQARLLRRARLQKVIALLNTQKPCPQVYLNDHGLMDDDVLLLCSALRSHSNVESLWMGDNMIGVPAPFPRAPSLS